MTNCVRIPLVLNISIFNYHLLLFVYLVIFILEGVVSAELG